jgi:GNAT superfamily N-acetyltransferase
MYTTAQVDTQSGAEVKQFIQLPYALYKGHPQWVPPPRADIRMMLNRDKHPFYEHSNADFFLALRDGEAVGRLAVMENQRFNDYHDVHVAQFYLFECINDIQVTKLLFDRAFTWARKRNLTAILGPKGFGPLDGYGILVEGFENRGMMTMMKYNFPYYKQFLEKLGFEKEVDFVSRYLDAQKFQLPERVHRIAKWVKERDSFKVHSFDSKRELSAWAPRLGDAYNRAFVDNWEYYPLTDTEIDYVVSNIITVADPHLIKVITREEDIVGFLFGFPDVSAALQRANGHLYPWHLIDLLLSMRRTKRLALNGAGILPEYHGIGGNTLLYTEMYNTIHDYGFEEAVLTQVAETAVQMRHDLDNVGAGAYQNHRVYRRNLA